jgi:hypothetical protein
MPDCEHALRAMITFQKIRKEAMASENVNLVIVAAKRESDYGVTLATTKKNSFRKLSMCTILGPIWLRCLG